MTETNPSQKPQQADENQTNSSHTVSNESTNIAPSHASEVDKASSKTNQYSTDISLIRSDDGKATKNEKQQSSFFMMKGYQILLVMALIGIFLLLTVYQTLFGHMEQPKQMVSIEKGQTYYGLLPQFQNSIPLFSSSIAKLYIKSQVHEPLHAGTYQIPANPTLIDVLNVLEKGSEVALMKVQIIEGKSAKDLYQTLKNTDGIQLDVLNKEEDLTDNTQLTQGLGLSHVLPEDVQNSTDPLVKNNLEGWFAPDTYYYNEGSSDKTILQDLQRRQQNLLNKAWENRADGLPYSSPYEALIMASIIEKETSLEEERKKVAAVFINRLKKGMRLQTDPTIIYGMGSRYQGNIKKEDIKEKTAYNTYQIDGLPPTPIALPSSASIEAALHPDDTDVLYFVATGHGGHKFSKTLAEHNQAVKTYLATLKNQSAQNHQNNE